MISRIIFWNIRSVNTQKSFERSIDLNKRNNYSYIALMEPIQSHSELDVYRKKLGMDKARANCSAKIWLFWNDNWEEVGSTDMLQQITMQFNFRGQEIRLA